MLQVFYVKTYFRRKIRLDVEALEIEDEAEMNNKVSFWLLCASDSVNSERVTSLSSITHLDINFFSK